MSSDTNLELWERHCKSDPKYLRWVKIRGGFTAINAQHQLENATSEWGPYGGLWGMRDFQWQIVPLDSERELVLQASFYYPGGEFPVVSSMRLEANGDTYKSLVTDCRSKALSCLGFNADVFLGKYAEADIIKDNRYLTDGTKKREKKKPPKPKETLADQATAIAGRALDKAAKLYRTKEGLKVKVAAVLEHAKSQGHDVDDLRKLPPAYLRTWEACLDKLLQEQM